MYNHFNNAKGDKKCTLAYKFRIYPTNEQKIYIAKNFGSCRFVYNHYLSDIKENGYKNAYTCIKDYTSNLKYEKIFLQEVDSIILRKELLKSLKEAVAKL